jgi:hypothetical protein
MGKILKLIKNIVKVKGRLTNAQLHSLAFMSDWEKHNFKIEITDELKNEVRHQMKKQAISNNLSLKEYRQYLGLTLVSSSRLSKEEFSLHYGARHLTKQGFELCNKLGIEIIDYV